MSEGCPGWCSFLWCRIHGGTKMEKTAMAAPEIHILGALLGSLITHWHIPDRQLLSQTAIKANDSLNKYGFK